MWSRTVEKRLWTAARHRRAWNNLDAQVRAEAMMFRLECIVLFLTKN
jgi:hypothetical protein